MPTDNETPVEPYIERRQNDLIRSSDWNSIQVSARRHIRTHTHTGDEQGTPIPRAGIEPHAIDGTRIDPASTVQVKALTVAASLKVGGQDVMQEVARLDGRANALDAGKVNRAGDTLTGGLTVGGPLSVKAAIRAPVLGLGSGQSSLPAKVSLGAESANTKIALHDDPNDLYGLGIQGFQFRLHVGNPEARFSFLNGAAGVEVMTVKGAGRVGINCTAPEETLVLGGKGAALELGAGVFKELNAGKIGYQRFSDGLDIVGAGTTQEERRLTIHAQGGTTFHGGLTVNGGAITPSIGNLSSAGIQFPGNPGGGGGDEAYIRYFVTGEDGDAEATKLLIGIEDNPNDVLAFRQAGAERMVLRSGELHLLTGTLRGTGRLHITNPELLYLLPRDGVWMTKDWGASGDLRVAGRLGAGTLAPQGQFEVLGGYATTNLAPEGLVINTGGASPDRAQIVWGDNTGWKLHFGTRSYDAQANFLPRVTFMDVGRVGINCTAPEETLVLGGKGAALELGAGVFKEVNAGKIGYQRFSDGLDIVGAGATQEERRLTIHAQGGTTFHGGLTVNGGAITPSVGNARTAGIQFPGDPGGGGGDEAYIRYFVTGEDGDPEATKLLIGIDNDANDVLAFQQAGAERLTLRDGEVQLGTGVLRGTKRLTIATPDQLYLSPRDGVWIYQGEGKSGDLFVGGTLVASRVSVSMDGLRVGAGPIVPTVGNGSGAGIMFPTDPSGGAGDQAYIRYFATGEGGSSEATKLLIGIDNDADDVLAFHQAGAERMVFRSGEIHLLAPTLRGAGRMHITGPELLFVLNAHGMIVSRAWGGNGNLSVEGTKNFRIAHPLDPQNKDLVHSSIEGPEAAVYYRGEARLTDGLAELALPPYFEALTRKEDRTVLLTPKLEGREPVSALAASAVVEGRFTVRAIDRNNASQAFYWEVKAVRADVERLVVEDARLPRPE